MDVDRRRTQVRDALRRLAARRKAEGKCRRCEAPAEPGRRSCAEHLADSARREREQRVAGKARLEKEVDALPSRL